MHALFVNWKTSLAGIATMTVGALALAGVNLAGAAPIDPHVALGMITAGFGLLFSKDSNVTGGSKPQ